MSNKRLKGMATVIVLVGLFLGLAAAQDIAQVILVVTDKELFAYSNLGGQWQRLRLRAGERVIESGRAERVAIVATDARALGFSALTNKWSEIRLEAGESVQTVEVRGAVGTVITSGRFLAFGASSGAWAAERLPIDQK